MDTSKKTLTCERAQDLMFLYIDGQLKDSDAAKLTAHLKSCEACRKELEERRTVLKSLNECEFIPPSSLKSEVMDKINTVPQERVSPMRRFIPIGAISGVAAAVMIFAVCRVFVFGGAVSDKAFDGAKFAAECEAGLTVSNSAPAEVCDKSTVGRADISEDAIYFVADMDYAADVADGAAAVPETAAPEKNEVYAVTSAIVAASPGVGLITEPQYGLKVNTTVTAQTAAPQTADKTTACSDTESALSKLFGKLNSSDSALIVCDSANVIFPKADSEEIISFDGAEFLHLTFAETGAVYDGLVAKLDEADVYYLASFPAYEYGTVEVFVRTAEK